MWGRARFITDRSFLKISDVELIPADKYLFVRIHTDKGVSGIGEVGVWGYLDAAASVIEKLKKHLIGEDPMRIEHIWQYLYRCIYFRDSVIMSAVSAIDIALWDIKGKYLGVPVYELMGGKCRSKVRSYAPVLSIRPGRWLQNASAWKRKGLQPPG